MARVRKDTTPDAQIAALRAKRLDHSRRRHELGNREQVAQRLIDESAGRREAAERAEEDGQKPEQTVAEIDAEVQQAKAEVADAKSRAQRVRELEAEIDQQVDGVIDPNVDFFIEAALASTEAYSALKAETMQGLQALESAGRDAAALWSTIRKSYIRRRLSPPREILVGDFGGPITELSKSPLPIPGGSVEAWARFLAQAAAEQNAPRLSNREALARFEAV